MKERSAFDFWYAVNNTEILRLPSRHLETFGSTVLNYYLLAETMDATNQVRIRAGRMQANPPQIIAPQAYAQTVLDGFGDQATRYFDWLREHEKDLRILQYGYVLKQSSFSEHTVTDDIKAVADRVQKEVEEKGDTLSAVLIGVDDPWDVCLVKLFWEVIQRSVGTNVRQMERRRLFEDAGGVQRAMRQQIESEFLAASRDASRVGALGQKLQSCGVFEEYQDRFFSLVKASKKLEKHG
jgi:hypothetical protein